MKSFSQQNAFHSSSFKAANLCAVLFAGPVIGSAQTDPSAQVLPDGTTYEDIPNVPELDPGFMSAVKAGLKLSAGYQVDPAKGKMMVKLWLPLLVNSSRLMY
jgi:hypothetical protein